MSREIKRVALDFKWPSSKVWEGFVLPERLRGEKCPDCENGQSHSGWWLQNLSNRMDMLVQDIGEQERGKNMHPWLSNDPYPQGHFENHRFVIDRPTEDIVDFMMGLAEFIGENDTPERLKNSFRGSSHVVLRALCKASGIKNPFVCKTCDGRGTLEKYAGQFEEADNWKEYEPPVGEGWQLWESVSEGSPISGVFATSGQLVDHLSTVGDDTGTIWNRESAESFVKAGWVPSGIITSEGVFTPDNM